MTNLTKLNWNVIEEVPFRDRTRVVFEQVAKTLTNTLGPYGATTIIEKFGEMHITKDGWQILKKIAFDEPVEQNILQLLVNISAQVVIKVGDGSTSSIVSANSILKHLEGDKHLKSLRPKELIDVLKAVVEEITDEIVQTSTKIDVESDPEFNQIYNLAMISTNGDKQVSEIIQTIYKETRNPSIDFIKSKSAKTSYEVIQGYKTNITYLDAIYVTHDDGTCQIKNPLILMFDHKLDKEAHLPIINEAAARAIKEDRRLVVIAPHYDTYLLNHIRTATNMEYRANGTTQVVFTRASLTNNLFQEQYNDFSIMAGAQVFRDTDIAPFHEEGSTADVNTFIGEVEDMIIGTDTTLIKGFVKRNEGMYEVALRDAKAKFAKLEDTHRELNIVDSQLYELKKRISKLSGQMGIIHVGGQSTLEKTSNFDLVEDAVKACESAYSYGYNIGGNLIIPITINKLLKEKYVEPTTERVVLRLLWVAFRDVFTKVLQNKYKDSAQSELNTIAETAIIEEKCYNLITDTYATDVVNPSYTDIEILRAATSIVSLLLSSNQYISISVDKEV